MGCTSILPLLHVNLLREAHDAQACNQIWKLAGRGLIVLVLDQHNELVDEHVQEQAVVFGKHAEYLSGLLLVDDSLSDNILSPVSVSFKDEHHLGT